MERTRRTGVSRIVLAPMIALAGASCGAREELVDDPVSRDARDAASDDLGAQRDGDANDGDATSIDAGGDDADADARADSPDGARPSIEAPLARSPWNGFATGSVWGAALGADHHTSRRPTFRWSAVADADHYELRLDDACTSNVTCAFASARVISVDSTRTTLDEDLAVSLVPPVGRRYFWGVRACRTLADGTRVCSEWTETRYVDVGRQRADYDGDGYAELVVGATDGEPEAGTAESAHLVFRGSATGLETRPAARLVPEIVSPARFAAAAVNVGDLNADGFGDLALMGSVPSRDGSLSEYVAHVYYGSPSGPSPEPSFVLRALDAECAIEASLVGPGDLDGDGFADVVVGTEAPDGCVDELDRTLAAQVYYGQSDGLSAAQMLPIEGPFSSFGRTFSRILGGSGDLDGDGYVELVMGLNDFLVHRPLSVFRGGASRLAEAAAYEVRPPAELDVTPAPRFYFPALLPGAGDVDGDGFADLVAARRPPYDVDPPPAIHVYAGSAAGPSSRPSASLSSHDADPIDFGQAIAGGDVDGDGDADLVSTTGSREAPFVAVYLGGAAGLSPDAIPLARPDPAPEPFALPVVAVAGDFDGDGSMDVAAGAPLPPGAGRVFVWSAIDAAPVELPSPTERVRAGFGSSLATTTF